MQQPPYQPPQGYYQAPVPRKPRRWPWILAIIVALFVGYAAGSAPHIGEPAAASITNAPLPPANTDGNAPTSAPTTQHFKVGETIKYGDWQLTVASATTNSGQDLSTPKPGNVYLLIDATLTNISTSQQTASSLIMFTLRDGSGLSYTETILTFGAPAPNGQVDPGKPVRGTLAYEIPSTMHTFTLGFIGHLGDQQAIFDITV